MESLTEQTTSLVKVGIVGPAVERSKSLLSHASSSTTVNGAIGTGIVPCETNEEGTVVAKVGGPPVLRVGLQGGDVLLELSDYKYKQQINISSYTERLWNRLPQVDQSIKLNVPSSLEKAAL